LIFGTNFNPRREVRRIGFDLGFMDFIALRAFDFADGCLGKK